MNIQNFQQEVEKISKEFTIVPNPNRPGLSNIFYQGKNYDLPVIASDDIPDEADQRRTYEFAGGIKARLWAVPEILKRLEDFMDNFEKNKELYEE